MLRLAIFSAALLTSGSYGQGSSVTSQSGSGGGGSGSPDTSTDATYNLAGETVGLQPGDGDEYQGGATWQHADGTSHNDTTDPTGNGTGGSANLAAGGGGTLEGGGVWPMTNNRRAVAAKVVLRDDDGTTGTWRVRVAYRTGDDESASATAKCCTDVQLNSGDAGALNNDVGTATGCTAATTFTTDPDSKASALGIGVRTKTDMETVTTQSVGGAESTSSYNGTNGVLTIKNRGGYSHGLDEWVGLIGPGTLYVTHLDLEPSHDYLQVDDADGNRVVLTGNYSNCLRQSTGLEGVYMDENLATGQHGSEATNDYHATEETQHKQTDNDGDLCHNILTGKLLMPAPVAIATNATTKLYFHTDMMVYTDGFFEGYELKYQIDDTVTAELTCSSGYAEITVGSNSDGISLLSDTTDGSGAKTSKPDFVYFRDEDKRRLRIEGDVYIENDGSEYTGGNTIRLLKFEPAGRWGYNLGQHLSSGVGYDQDVRTSLPYAETTVYGPRDSHAGNGGGHSTEAQSYDTTQGEYDMTRWGDSNGNQFHGVPYYSQGGSTGTEAPDLMGGGPEGARVFNKHGDVIPTSARGMHPDYQAAEEIVLVKEWDCTDYDADGLARNGEGGDWETSARSWDPKKKEETVSRCKKNIQYPESGTSDKLLIRSQGSPPAPMYQLEVRHGTAGERNLRDSVTIQLIDIAEYEPKGSFSGDLDPLTRRLAGLITVVAPSYAMGLFGFRLYPTANGETNLPLIYSENDYANWEQWTTKTGNSTTSSNTNDYITEQQSSDSNEDPDNTNKGSPYEDPQFTHTLARHCPPDVSNNDWAALLGSDWAALAQEPCGNDNPYSPICKGKSCAFVNILAGSQGEFYLSRFDNIGNAENPQTVHAGKRNQRDTDGMIGGGPVNSSSSQTSGSGGADGGGPRNGSTDTQHAQSSDAEYDNMPNQYTANTAQRNYSHNEYAQIYFPKSGWLTPILIDVSKECRTDATYIRLGGNMQTMSVETDSINVTDNLGHYGGSGTDDTRNDSSGVLNEGCDGDTLYLTEMKTSTAFSQFNAVTQTMEAGTIQSHRDHHDLRDAPLSEYIDLLEEASVMTWATDREFTSHGWTLIYQPDYPEVEIPMDTPMARQASGYRLVPVYHSPPTRNPKSQEEWKEFGVAYNSEHGHDTSASNYIDGPLPYSPADATTNADSYVETYDWLIPNVTCTPTTMHCPIPTVWAHINYTTPSLYPEPAEGSCLQQKTGSSSLVGCGTKEDLDSRWYSANSITTTKPGVSLQNNNEEDNGQGVAADTYSRTHNADRRSGGWAGNCGDATSYFWFEKIACGSTRTFHTDRSLIVDFVQLTPTWEDIQTILDIYYTTKAPLQSRDSNSVGFTFIAADYNIPPVLPPKVNCTCEAAMDAYASLLAVASKTPTPGAPVTLDPEVLNTGMSKMIATLRMYQDPTYSIPASSTAVMPIVVTRFYLEVSTKFTRNRITISDCTSSHRENLLNDSAALKPREDYCDNTTFDTLTERAPNGVTHMDRLSMKKFKFQPSDNQSNEVVYMQCKIRACAQQPCGICQPNGRRQLVDLSPAEGEMFSPPTNVMVSDQDPNALRFPATVPLGVALSQAAPPTQTARRPQTNKPIEIASELILTSVTAEWAIANRVAMTSTLRSTLSLRADEDLVITSIAKLSRRKLQGRNLQSGGIKIDFVVGVSDQSRAMASAGQLNQLASGSPALVMKFASTLDSELVARGAAPVALSANSLAFTQAKQVAKSTDGTYAAAPAAAGSSTAWSSRGFFVGGSSDASASSEDEKKDSKDDKNGLILMAFLGGACLMGLVAICMYVKHVKKGDASHDAAGADTYNAKVANLDGGWDQNWQGEEQWNENQENAQGW